MGDWIQEYAVCETASKLVGPRNKYHQLAIWPDMQCVSLGKGGGSDSSKCFLCIAVNYIPSHHSHRRRLVRGIVSRPIEPKWVKFLQRFLQGVNQDLNSGSHYTFKIWVVDLPSSFAPGCRPVKKTICRLNVHPGEVSVWCGFLRCRAHPYVPHMRMYARVRTCTYTQHKSWQVHLQVYIYVYAFTHKASMRGPHQYIPSWTLTQWYLSHTCVELHQYSCVVLDRISPRKNVRDELHIFAGKKHGAGKCTNWSRNSDGESIDDGREEPAPGRGV